MTTPNVQYGYATGSGNTIRPTEMTYPNGRELNVNYGSANSQADLLSRIDSLIDDDGTTLLTEYTLPRPGDAGDRRRPAARDQVHPGRAPPARTIPTRGTSTGAGTGSAG